jgi:hypothetical protein
MPYSGKGRLIDDISKIEKYKPILEKDDFKTGEAHWRRVSKNTISLFHVLIDQDLSDLVIVLHHYPKYTEWVCEHFRYAYSYSENEADIDAASKLLYIGEPYFSKQFVRNVVRKLPKLDEMDFEEIQKFSSNIASNHGIWHPIIVNHYYELLVKTIDELKLHPLQKIVLKKPISHIELQETYEYGAQDRDAVLDIPYMN